MTAFIKSKETHRDYLCRQFTPAIDLENLADQDRAIIDRYGAWMEALENGLITPHTVAQERFLKVCAGKLAPVSRYEIAWLNYKTRCEFLSEFLSKVEALQKRSEHLAYRKAHYMTLTTDELKQIWENRASIDFDETQLLRDLLRERLRITPGYRHGAEVCPQCGQVGQNCSCDRSCVGADRKLSHL